jgi:hypothetical protein
MTLSDSDFPISVEAKTPDAAYAFIKAKGWYVGAGVVGYFEGAYVDIVGDGVGCSVGAIVGDCVGGNML